jgi:hypothetical protein
MDAAQLADAARFDPSVFETFRFVDRSIDEAGEVRLRYALDDAYLFEERFTLPVPATWDRVDADIVERLLALLHWVAGTSYYKTAAPPRVSTEVGVPPPATARLLEALYSEGLGEFAVVNDLPSVPRPSFAVGPHEPKPSPSGPLDRILLPVGAGKDSIVALEIVRRSGKDLSLFSVDNSRAIEQTVAVAGLPRLQATRRLDPALTELNARGALNGHVPVTAILSVVALLTAALHSFDAVALANERSASIGNTSLAGVEVNHQFSKSWRVEQLLQRALAEVTADLRVFSVLRTAPDLTIARAFADLPEYHAAFTSCNRIFELDPSLRWASWCADCDKCRFVFLILAPFLDPETMFGIFGKDMLDDDGQFEGFALLTATGGHKPFECVGEVEESVAALRLLSTDPRWSDHRVVRRSLTEIVPRFGDDAAVPWRVFGLGGDHAIPADLLDAVHAVLGT